MTIQRRCCQKLGAGKAAMANIHALRGKTFLYLLAPIFLLTLWRPLFAVPQDSLVRINVQQAKVLLDKDSTIVVLDVRTPEEFNSQLGRLPGAINVPVQELDKRVGELNKYRAHTILVYCRSGNRSMRASTILLKKGFKIIHMDGGMLQWNATFVPTKPAQDNRP